MNRTEHELELMRLYLDGVASLEETQELESLIVKDASVRQDFLRYSHLDSALAGVRRSQPSVGAPRRSVWLSWRPLTAAAAGLVLGLFSASVVWAIASPHNTSKAQQALVVANSGFEDAEPPLARGVPANFGEWSGDFTESVGPPQGIAPLEGRRMLRFLRSDSEREPMGASTYVGDMFQVVDLRPWRDAISDGTAVAELSASFAAVPGEEMVFQTCLWAFAGEPSRLPENWTKHLREELAYGSGSSRSTGDSTRWQRVTGRMIVPPDAEMVVIELKVSPASRRAGAPIVFHGVYADEVELVLRSGGAQVTAAAGKQH